MTFIVEWTIKVPAIRFPFHTNPLAGAYLRPQKWRKEFVSKEEAQKFIDNSADDIKSQMTIKEKQ
jgi:hypothetical protein